MWIALRQNKNDSKTMVTNKKISTVHMDKANRPVNLEQIT